MEVDDELQTLLDEQRRELAAAEAVDSDLMFAYQLQMQEAMNASLPNDAVSSSKPALDDDGDDVNIATTSRVFAEEILKYEQQVQDQKAAEAEIKRIRDDLNRRIHDQAFAREILAVPEKQWNETGDHVQRPYGEGSSKGVVQNGESFRVYVKGLIREDVEKTVRVSEKEKGKVVAGIGVAVCDPSGILVFEVSKGFVEVMTDEVAEMKALIEGFDVAVMLGLMSVVIVLDSQTIIQYVTGKVRPRQGNIVALVEQATLRQRKLTHCVLSHVTHNTVNFALKLASDAVVSHVRRPAENNLRKNITETCTICLEDTDVDHMFLVHGCLHYYCFSCMNKHVEVKLHQGILPKCPHEGCKSGLKLDICKRFLTPKLYDLMSERVKEVTIPMEEKIYCPNPKCSTLMSKADVRISGQTFVGGAEQAGARMCLKCRDYFCINCRVPWHQNMTCFDYRKLNPFVCVDDVKLKSLATQSRWRQCVKCNHMVSLGKGCYHIYCRCGHEFCYTCGAEWKNKKATCSCLIWDERNIVYGAGHQPRRG